MITMEAKYEGESSEIEASMSKHEKELSEMREKMFKGLEKIGKKGIITKRSYQYVDEVGKEYFLKKEGLRDVEGNPPPVGKYKESRHKIEGFVNGNRVEADFAEYPTFAAQLVEREVTSRKQYSLKLNGTEVPEEEAEKFVELYGKFAYDLDKERKIMEEAQEEKEISKVRDILF